MATSGRAARRAATTRRSSSSAPSAAWAVPCRSQATSTCLVVGSLTTSGRYSGGTGAGRSTQYPWNRDNCCSPWAGSSVASKSSVTAAGSVPPCLSRSRSTPVSRRNPSRLWRAGMGTAFSNRLRVGWLASGSPSGGLPATGLNTGSSRRASWSLQSSYPATTPYTRWRTIVTGTCVGSARASPRQPASRSVYPHRASNWATGSSPASLVNWASCRWTTTGACGRKSKQTCSSDCATCAAVIRPPVLG